MNEELQGRVDRCIGATPEEKWNARSCLPFKFAHHTKNARDLEAYVVSGELMPYDTKTGFRYVGVPAIECVCLDGRQVTDGGLSKVYAGCAPDGIPAREDRSSFQVRTHSKGTRDEYEVVLAGAGPHHLLSYLGFPNKVDSIDGTPARDARAVEALVDGLLAAGRRTVHSWRSDSTEILYLTRDTAEHLTQRMRELRVLDLRAGDWWRSQGSAIVIAAGEHAFVCDTQTPDDATTRCIDFANELEKATRAEHRAPIVTAPVDCSELHTLVAFFSVRRPSGTLDLRYVDWKQARGERSSNP